MKSSVMVCVVVLYIVCFVLFSLKCGVNALMSAWVVVVYSTV